MLYFRPRLLDELRGYDRAKLAADLSAGLTVAAVALPLAMAFAIASGLAAALGPENLVPALADAWRRARELVDSR